MKIPNIAFFLAVFFAAWHSTAACQPYTTTVEFEPDEYWWGGAVGAGSLMPYVEPMETFDLAHENRNNQVVPFFLSSKGRYVWSDYPFSFEVGNRRITFTSQHEKIEVQHGGTTLREAYLTASKAHFPPTGTIPDPLFFSVPQYNTWIELVYDQNQKDVLAYAENILKNGFPPGILMIDDNWQQDYGHFEFSRDRFPDPRGMVERLHEMGFKVMLWVCPFVSPDSRAYRKLSAQGYLLKERTSDNPAMIRWWNGVSACFDLTNPAAKACYVEQLKHLQTEYGIDGFKFDAGDNGFYREERVRGMNETALSVDHTSAWASLGLEFPINEFRACWKMGGQPLVQRLGDKYYAWKAIRLLIPEMVAAGLFGHAYTCPDMVGGGEYKSFEGVRTEDFDQRLIVRSAQTHALMPMMQFSVAPWRILDAEHLAIVRDAALLHVKFGDYILKYAKIASETGEPIVRHMEYAFPNEGFAQCHDQFMLGDDYLVAPVVTDEEVRQVRLPRGTWEDENGKRYKGGKSYSVAAPLSRLIHFRKIR